MAAFFVGKVLLNDVKLHFSNYVYSHNFARDATTRGFILFTPEM